MSYANFSASLERQEYKSRKLRPSFSLSSLPLLPSPFSSSLLYRFASYCSLGILTGGSAVLQVGMAYIYIYLFDNFGMKTTLQLVGAYSFAICMFAAITYLPTKYTAEVTYNEDNSKRVQKYLALFRSKKYLIYLLTILVDCFAYGVSGVHQVYSFDFCFFFLFPFEILYLGMKSQSRLFYNSSPR